MEEILHQLIGSLSQYFQGLIHLRLLAGFLPSTVCANSSCIQQKTPKNKANIKQEKNLDFFTAASITPAFCQQHLSGKFQIIWWFCDILQQRHLVDFKPCSEDLMNGFIQTCVRKCVFAVNVITITKLQYLQKKIPQLSFKKLQQVFVDIIISYAAMPIP